MDDAWGSINDLILDDRIDMHALWDVLIQLND